MAGLAGVAAAANVAHAGAGCTIGVLGAAGHVIVADAVSAADAGGVTGVMQSVPPVLQEAGMLIVKQADDDASADAAAANIGVCGAVATTNTAGTASCGDFAGLLRGAGAVGAVGATRVASPLPRCRGDSGAVNVKGVVWSCRRCWCGWYPMCR